MRARKNLRSTSHGGRGVTAVMVIVALVVFPAVSALAIDLTALDVARIEAQRAGEAAVLAGTKVFVETGFISGKASQAATVKSWPGDALSPWAIRKRGEGKRLPCRIAA